MCWYLNGRKCLISYLLILRDHASLGNKHETKLNVKKSNFTVWSKLVYNDSHANFALEQILIPASRQCQVSGMLHIVLQSNCIPRTVSLSHKKNSYKTKFSHRLWDTVRYLRFSVTTRSTGSSIVQPGRYNFIVK